MKVAKSDLFWNYGASFMRIASGAIVLPLILRMLSTEDVGLWGIMVGLYAVIVLFDFGFSQTFSRSITYIFTGATELVSEGIGTLKEGGDIHYPLLKGTIKAMKSYYAAVSILMFILLFTGGYWFVERLLADYAGDRDTARIAWYLYGILLCYQFYTFYYDTLLVGRGMIKRSKQIIVISQSLHIIIAPVLLLSGFGIISMVISQSIATIVNKTLANRAFYDTETKENLAKVKSENWIKIFKTIWFAAYKTGLGNLSVVFTNKMLALFGALYISLSAMGSYNTLSKMVVDMTFTLALVWFGTYSPKLIQERARNSMIEVKRLYIKAQFIVLGVFVVIATGVILFGDWGVKLIGSATTFLDYRLMLLLFFTSLLDAFTVLSTSILLSRNTVPHYKSQVITAVVTIVALLVSLRYTNYGVVNLIVVPLVTQLAYQYWRWTYMVYKELNIKFADYTGFLAHLPKNMGIR